MKVNIKLSEQLYFIKRMKSLGYSVEVCNGAIKGKKIKRR
ncbi:Uncharacterised protein [Campylobacter hyointestinalis subsp. hyointestinalis]|uniref:Uncharacterized protein n=1 Tax=Campylobacter hyointestinalis subsp. hyointestinalis TaxID=91352 RepID=A0A9W5EWZ5_CAMHY|nr:Uncharacterised protein [Campylobacter hyointestinalis subsp. hyointestinalis]CUU81834.1 Uncharacterised protein [Campylobacter hyointestinalis subsp. hyointestinalis]